MKITPLNQEHKDLNAKMVEFANYEMPIMYSSVKEEYQAVRQACGIFDISHMAPIYVKGEQAIRLLNSISCRNLQELKINQVLYSAFTTKQGTVVDDVTFYKINDHDYLVIANAANREKVLSYLSDTQKNFSDVEISTYQDYILLALQGRQAPQKLEVACKQQSLLLTEFFYYEFSLVKNANHQVLKFSNGLPWIISRTGYTGEDGYEILLPVAEGKQLWKIFQEQQVLPCGLAARDTLRMEVFYPLYGHELSLETTPLQGGIGWAVHYNKEFAGKEIIERQKEQGFSRTRGFILEEGGVPRQGFAIFNSAEGGKQVGTVTSGSFSFQWNKGFGIAYLQKEYTKIGKELWIDLRGKRKKIKTYGLSPYKGSIQKRC